MVPKVCKWFWKHRLGPKWGGLFTRYETTLDAKSSKWLRDVFRNLDAHKLCETCLIKELKELKQVCMQKIMDSGIDQKLYLLDLFVLGGYDTTQNRVSAGASLREDFGTDKGIPENEELKALIDESVSQMRFEAPPCSFKEFVSYRDSWAQTGVSDLGEPCIVEESGKERKVKSKWFAGLSLSDAEIVEECLKGTPAVTKSFLKVDEPARARVVQAYDTRSIIRCSYLEECISSFNGSSSWTSIGFGSQDKLRMREEICSDIGGYMLCMDQSSFDIHQPKWAVLYAMECIFKRIRRLGLHDVNEVIAAEERSLEDVKVVFEGDEFPWEYGLLSGLRWTALIGSILNRAESLYAIADQGVRVLRGKWQGDDALMRTDKRVDVVQAGERLSALGLELNVNKTWNSRYRCEYLHELYDKRSVYGYPARAFGTLVWRKPALKPRAGGVSEIYEVVDLARMASRRGVFMSKAWLFKWITCKIKINKKKLEEALDTPCALGGLGFGEWGNIGIRFVSDLDLTRRRCRVKSKVGWDVAKKHDVLSSLLLLRLEAEGLALGKVRFKAEFTPVRRRLGIAFDTPSFSLGVYNACPAPTRTWGLQHFKNTKDVYEKKVLLEVALVRGDDIDASMLPPGPWSNLGNPGRIYRIYRKFRDYSFNLASSAYSGEMFARTASTYARTWNGLVWSAASGLLDWARWDSVYYPSLLDTQAREQLNRKRKGMRIPKSWLKGRAVGSKSEKDKKRKWEALSRGSGGAERGESSGGRFPGSPNDISEFFRRWSGVLASWCIREARVTPPRVFLHI